MAWLIVRLIKKNNINILFCVFNILEIRVKNFLDFLIINN